MDFCDFHIFLTQTLLVGISQKSSAMQDNVGNDVVIPVPRSG